jgi:hypothetical protein
LEVSCTGFETRTYNGGLCVQSDTQLDALRFKTAFQFSKTLLGMGDQYIGCLDYQKLREEFSFSIQDNAVAHAGQGFGIYTGLDHISEYFSLLSPRVNHGFVSLTPANGPKVAYVSANGTIFTTGLPVINKYLIVKNQELDSSYTRNPTDYLEVIFQFTVCSIRASKVTVPSRSTILPNKNETGIISLATMMEVTANYKTPICNLYPSECQGVVMNKDVSLGVHSICKQHDKYCVGANRQFTSFDECVTQLRQFQGTKSQCGTAAGNTLTCRAKHQFMVQINPNVHCPHLGVNSAACIDCVALDEVSYLEPDTDLILAIEKVNLNLFRSDKANAWQYADYCPLEKQYVKILIPGTEKILSLTEVQFVGAQGVAVTASSISHSRNPNLIINGVIDGNWHSGKGDVTHTYPETEPWLMIELAPGGSLEYIVVYGRTDCCTERMNGAVAELIRGKI